jgi:hypothetical protein
MIIILETAEAYQFPLSRANPRLSVSLGY